MKTIYLSLLVWFVSQSISGCTEDVPPEINKPMIDCTEMQPVENWLKDTLLTGYIFSYPLYLKDEFPNPVVKVYENEGAPFNFIKLKFGYCGGSSDPCIPQLYNNSISIDPPSKDTLILRVMPAVKTIEVCNNDFLYGVLYIITDNEEPYKKNGLFFTYIKEVDKYYIGGDFFFSENYIDDVIKICKSFVPIE